LGELGFGFKSIGRGIKKAGKGAVKVGKVGFKVGKIGFNVAALSAKSALKIANAVKGSLCSGAAGAASSATPMGAAFCAAMKAKDNISVRKLLPAAVAEAADKAKATQVQAQAAVADPTSAIVAQLTPSAAPLSGADAVEACFQDRRAAGHDESQNTTRKLCQKAYGRVEEYDGGLSDADTNLLAALYGADPYDLAYALNGVDPGQIGAVFTSQEIPTLAFSTVAVAAGLWMLFRG
jgi:hypothetical protein